MNGLWFINEINPLPFLKRFRVYNPKGLYIATFKRYDDAVDYVSLKYDQENKTPETCVNNASGVNN